MSKRGFRAPEFYMGERITLVQQRYLGYVFEALVRFGLTGDEASNLIANQLSAIMLAGRHDENPDQLADRVWKADRAHASRFEATLRSERLSRQRSGDTSPGWRPVPGMPPPPVVIAEKTFTPTTTWNVSRHTRQNGTGFWQLTELSGKPFTRERTDWPTVYDDGHVVYDRPEQIPKRVREWCDHALWPYRSMSSSELKAAVEQLGEKVAARRARS